MAGFTLIKIFTDTNILHASQAHLLIPAKVATYISDHKRIESVELKWQLPKMVIDERRHQMLQASVNLAPKISELEKLLGHALGINKEIMEDRIDSKINKTIGELGIEICNADTNKINWPEIIERSAKRLPPFEISGEKEKGFRDAVIAETFLQEIKKSPSTPRSCLLVLVSGDKRLREYITEKTVDSKNVRIMDSLDDLKSLLNAISSEITEEFLEELTPKAKKVFWDFEKKDGLYKKEKVLEKIKEKYDTELDEVIEFFPGARRRQSGIILGEQTFIRKKGQTVIWSRDVEIESKIIKGGITLANFNSIKKDPETSLEEQVVASYKSIFSVEWQLQITTKGNISKPKINNIIYTGHDFEDELF